ncbi:hypothetical protein acdb102_35880 [Acidothermaceae bacterium B102]|nr:hypothetical protein acdb102_35880 [Acidothermaceae bacterium B102]
MRLRRVGHVALVAAVLCTGLVELPAASAAGTTTIGFEDLADGTSVGTQYSGLGVQLDPPAALTVLTNTTIAAHGGTQVLKATDSVCDPSSHVGLSLLLSTPRTQVGLWVHDPYTNDPSARQVTMQAFAADGSSAGMTSLSITSGLGWQQLLLVADTGKTVDHATVSVDTGICQMLFDDLSFDAPASIQPPDVGWEDVATTPVAVERGGSTVTTATLRRHNGSTGRVNLTVTGLPSGVSGVVSPAQANGSVLSSTVTVTLSGTSGAPVTSTQATLHATPVDSTAGSAAATSPLPVTVTPPSVSLALAAPAPADLYRGDAVTVAAVLTRHSLSAGLVSLSATGPSGVTVTVSPSSVSGSAATTSVTLSVVVAPGAPRDPAGTIQLVASSADAAAAPPGQPVTLVVAAPVRIPQLVMTPILPGSLVLRAGAGYSRVDATITAVDLPAGAIVQTAAHGLPADITVEPSAASFPASAGTSLFYVKLTANTGTSAASSGYASFDAQATVPGHGVVTATRFFQLIVVPTIRYALAARGIEVTQGTQTIGPTACSSIPTRDLGHIDSSVPYTGVKLVDGDLTVARVYVSAFLLTNIKSLPNVGVRLHAYRGGKEISGGSLSPTASPAGVTLGDAVCVTDADRAAATNVYTFVLPPSWTYGTVTLQAEILPLTPTVTGPVLDECGSLFCQTFKRFTLRNIRFNRIRWPGIMPIRIIANGVDGGPAAQALYKARMLDPGDPYVWGYQGDVDISNLIALADYTATNPLFQGISRRDIVEGGAAAEVAEWSRILPGRDIVMGIAPQVNGLYGVANGRTIADLPANGYFAPHPSAVVAVYRPLTSVAHELGHILGRPHAGQACPGTGPNDSQAGEPWLPDDQGFLQGIGLDLWGIAADPTAFTPTAAAPYRVIARNLPGSAAEFYDYMSYCAGTNEVPSATNAPDVWLSPRNWNAEVDALTAWTAKTGGATGPALVAAASPVNVMTVTAIGRGQEALILSTVPEKGNPLPVGTSGPIAVGYNTAGVAVTQAGVQDTVLDETGLHTYTGSVAAAGVVKVAIVDRAGAPLAASTRSAHAPTIRLTSPRPGATVGGSKAVRVSWKAADADHDKLVETVETSADDGRTWRLAYHGAASSVLLPAGYFLPSARARVRVTVNDGFRSMSTVSGRFRALQAPATVHIDSPSAGATFNSDGSTTLSGSASTVQGPVAGSRLVWYLDGKRIARGAHVAVRNLPPGHRVLTLKVVGDPGRGARIKVVVRAVTPPFLAVSLPARINSTARFVDVHLRSGAAVTIRWGSKSLLLKAHGHGVLRVPVKPGHGEVDITLTATLRRATYTLTRAVQRR